MAKKLSKLEIQEEILKLLEPLKDSNFKIFNHPFDPTDETVRTTQMINIEFVGETVTKTASRTMGNPGARYPQTIVTNYNINVWYKVSRYLNSNTVIPYVEQIQELVHGVAIVPGLTITQQGIEKPTKDNYDFNRYVVKVAVDNVRS